MSTAYEFRKLCAEDIFPVCNIISKIGIKEFKSCFDSKDIKAITASGGNKDEIAAAVGVNVFVDVAGIVLANIGKCENEMFSFLGSVAGLKSEAVRKMDLSEFADMIVSFFKKEELKDFFKVVSKFLK